MVTILQGLAALAGPQGGHQEAEVRENQREEDVHPRGGPLQGNNHLVCTIQMLHVTMGSLRYLFMYIL